MDSHLKLMLPLSLKEMVLRQVAILFCSDSDNLVVFYQSLDSRLSPSEIKEWLEATEKRLKGWLPESLNKQVIDRMRAICFEIRKWKKLNYSAYRVSEAEIKLPDLSKPCWTTAKAIDYRKAAEQYILCDGIEDWRRYTIACINCMETHIPLLWNRLSEEDKRLRCSYYRTVPYLEDCWPLILKGEEYKVHRLWRNPAENLTSFNRWAFEKSAKDDNQVAVEYFFLKLTPAEREASLMRTAHNVLGGDVLCYLLSIMTPEQQMEIIKARPVSVLLCFLDLSRLHLLPENAGLIWTFLPQSDYGSLMRRINTKFAIGNRCFPMLLQEFFKNAPLDFIIKSFEGQESDTFPPACRLLCALVEDEDSESIEVLFRHADVASTLKLLLRDKVFCVFYKFILKEEWRGVEACLRKAALSKEGKETLKGSFKRFLDQRVTGACVERKFRRFFELVDDEEELSSNSAVVGNELFQGGLGNGDQSECGFKNLVYF